MARKDRGVAVMKFGKHDRRSKIAIGASENTSPTSRRGEARGRRGQTDSAISA